MNERQSARPQITQPQVVYRTPHRAYVHLTSSPTTPAHVSLSSAHGIDLFTFPAAPSTQSPTSLAPFSTLPHSLPSTTTTPPRVAPITTSTHASASTAPPAISCILTTTRWHPINANRLVTGARGGLAAVWDINPGSSGLPSLTNALLVPEKAAGARPCPVRAAWAPGYSPNALLTCGGAGTRVKIWDIRGPAPAMIPGEARAWNACAVAWCPVQGKQHLFATGHEDGIVRLWDVRRGEPLAWTVAHIRGKVAELSWSPNDARVLLSTGGERNVRILAVDEKKATLCLMCSVPSDSPVSHAVWTDDGSAFVANVSGTDKRSLSVVHCADRFESPCWSLATLGRSPISAFDVARDGDGNPVVIAATGGAAPSLCVWNAQKSLLETLKRPSSVEELLEKCKQNEATSATGSEKRLSKKIATSSHMQLSPTRPPKTSTLPLSSQQPQQSQQQQQQQQQVVGMFQTEISGLIQFNKIPVGVTIVSVSVESSSCLIKCAETLGEQRLALRTEFQFPSLYPNNAAPTFRLVDSSFAEQQNQRVIRRLRERSLQLVAEHRPCLLALFEVISQFLRAELNSLSQSSETIDGNNGDADERLTLPCPRLSGCCFSPDGKAVFFVQRRSTSLSRCPRRYHQLLNIVSTTKTAPRPEFSADTSSRITRSFFSAPQQLKKAGQTKPFSYSAAHTSFSMVPDFFDLTNSSQQTKQQQQQQHPQTGIKKDGARQATRGLPAMFLTEVPSAVSRELAMRYTLAGTNERIICLHNARVAGQCGRADLQRMWSFVASILDPATTENQLGLQEGARQGVPIVSNTPVHDHIEKLVKFYTLAHDVQTLAMLVCVFSRSERRILENAPDQPVLQHHADPIMSPHLHQVTPDGPLPQMLGTKGMGSNQAMNGSTRTGTSLRPSIPQLTSGFEPSFGRSSMTTMPSMAVPLSAASSPAVHSPSRIPQNLSLKAGSALASSHIPKFAQHSLLPQTSSSLSMKEHPERRILLNPNDRYVYESFRLEYIDLLQRWQLYPQMKEVLKCGVGMFAERSAAANDSSVSSQSSPLFSQETTFPSTDITHGSDSFSVDLMCPKCGKSCSGPFCEECSVFIAHCALCQLPVKGLHWACCKCGHGGHLLHMRRWFLRNGLCPTGCGCACLSLDEPFQ